MMNTPVLSLRGLTKRFGSVLANDRVSLELHRGEILALLGENGAGKTTLMNMLFGHYLPDDGEVLVAGESGELELLPSGHPQAALAVGIGMVHQHFTLAENLSALDNILLGSEPLFALYRDRSTAIAKIEKIMERTGLTAPLNEKVVKLSVGERQRVEILKAIYRDARILVLDEPTAVLTPQETDSLFENISRLAEDGLSVIFISHKLREVMSFSHRIAVLRAGRKVGEMATDQASEGEIARLMVGQDTPRSERKKLQRSAPVLTIKDISIIGDNARRSLHKVSLDVHGHEIVGVAGVSGNGQYALAALTSGLMIPDHGDVFLHGEHVTAFSPANFIANGVGRIPEDRHRDGVVGAMSVAENLIIERLQDGNVQKYGFLRKNAIRADAGKALADYDVRGPGMDAKARLLSGGNIQKLILARVFERSPNLIIANQPTRGLDLGAAAEVGRRLLQARARGAGILLISEDLDEILSLSDRIMVIHGGHLAAAPSKDRQTIGLMMAGEEAA